MGDKYQADPALLEAGKASLTDLTALFVGWAKKFNDGTSGAGRVLDKDPTGREMLGQLNRAVLQFNDAMGALVQIPDGIGNLLDVQLGSAQHTQGKISSAIDLSNANGDIAGNHGGSQSGKGGVPGK